jgi:type IX secretion system PorP/SprF family membrane protein
MRSLKLFVVICLISTAGFGQDVHFSQFYAAPLNLNPSQTGMINGNLRGIANYRNQWSSFAPYTTYNGSLDVNLGHNFLDNDLIGIGINFYNDVAGDAEFSTTHAALSVSYIKTMGNKFARNYLSVGFSGGMVQRSVDYTKMTFGTQFNGYEYDPSLFNGETVAFENLSYFVLGAGITWMLVPHDGLNFYMGVAFHHLNAPNQSFTGLVTDNLYMKTTGNMGAQIPVGQSTFLVPAVLAMVQGPHYQLNGGMSVKYIINDLDYKSTALSLGVYQRIGLNNQTDYKSDATIVAARFDYLNFSMGLSYDINISGLQDASNGLGGPEVSLTYTTDLPQRDRKVDCPKF